MFSLLTKANAATFRILKKTNVTFWIFVAMIVGFLLGQFAPKFAVELQPLSTLFLSMVQCLITPLVFSTLVVGIAGHGDDLKRVGKLAYKSFVYFEIATTIALFVGLAFVNWLKPGVGINLNNVVLNKEGQEAAANAKDITWGNMLKHLVPDKSFFEAAAKNEILQIVVCAIMFSCAIFRTPIRYRKPMLEFLESMSFIMFAVTELVMYFAPVGVAAALAFTIGAYGLAVLKNLALLVGTLYLALFTFMLAVFLPVLLICKVPLVNAMKHIGPPALIAFSTTSSEAALPRAMENLERFGVPSSIVAFVMPTGYSFNLDGTTLYLAIAGVFVAQAENHPFPFFSQFLMLLTLILTSKGVAAVPRASMVVLLGALHSFGIRNRAVELIIGVDAFMDMARTTTNLIGNCVATIVVAVWEGEFDYELAHGRKKLGDLEKDGELTVAEDDDSFGERRNEKSNPIPFV